MIFASVLIVALLLLLLSSRRGSLNHGTLDLRTPIPPTRGVVERIFSGEDAQYAQSFPKRIRSMVQRDRRALALTWIRQIRDTTLALTRQHVQAARRNPSLRLSHELRLAATFVALLVSCELLAFAVATFGPSRSRVLLSAVASRWQALQARLDTAALPAYNAA